MSVIDFISNHTFLVAILLILLFLSYHFFIRPKKISAEKKEESPQTKPEQKNFAKTLGEKMSSIQKSISESEFVKNFEEEKKTAKSTDYFPKELLRDNKEEADMFSTDFSKFNKKTK